MIALYKLQQIDSQIDRIRIVRGELPLEVRDLEDEVVGLETRIDKFKVEETALEQKVADRKTDDERLQRFDKKYEEQQKNVRNNREYESLSKEVEFQTLEIQLCEKRIKEAMVELDHHKQEVERVKTILEETRKRLRA